MSITPQRLNRPLYWPPIVERIAEILAGEDVYLVGGVVRDVYMRRPVHDLDLVALTDGQPIARRIANTLGGAYYPLDASRGIGRAIIESDGVPFTIDVAQARGPDLHADLVDRDFTVNALATPLDQLEMIIDPTDGLTDLSRQLVRQCSPHSISNDPVRMLRAVRISLSHGFHLTAETKAAIRENLPNLNNISEERIRDEFFKLLGGPRPHAALTILSVLGILDVLLPETSALMGVTQSPPHIYDVWRHTVGVVESMGQVFSVFGQRRDDETTANFGMGTFKFAVNHLYRDIQTHLAATQWPNDRSHRALLILAALAHDIGKPSTRSVGDDGKIHFYRHEDVGADMVAAWGRRLALSNDEIDRLKTIVFHHLRPAQLARESSISRRSKYRFWHDVGVAGVDICLLSVADQLGKYGPTLPQDFWLKFVDNLRDLLEGYFQEQETLVAIKPLINGNDLIQQLGLQPSRQLGQLIEALREAQALQQFSTPAEALNWARDWLANIGS